MRHSRRADSIGAETPPLQIAPSSPAAALQEAILPPSTETPPQESDRPQALDNHQTESAARLDRAVNLLRRNCPEHSAAEPMRQWQQICFVVLSGALVLGAGFALRPTLNALLALLALPFFCVVLLRALALWQTGSGIGPATAPAPPGDGDGGQLAPYTVLVPLFHEANVVPDVIEALSAIDYPAELLQIIFIAESVDGETRAALASACLPPHMHVTVVPDGAPRTKPRALNYALSEANGDYVVVYDAEDMPEADQLRRALCRLRAAPQLGCVQARLNVYNSDQSWLTRGIA
jgi:hypothetical protein